MHGPAQRQRLTSCPPQAKILRSMCTHNVIFFDFRVLLLFGAIYDSATKLHTNYGLRVYLSNFLNYTNNTCIQ